MNAIRDLFNKVGNRASVVREVFAFLRARKVYWLVPLVLVLLLVGAIFFIASQPAVTPFVYTLF